MSKNDVVVVITSAARTPIGSFLGSLSSLKPQELGHVAIEAAIKRSNLQPNDINEVIMGHSLQAGQGQNPARQAAIASGIPLDSPAYGINMLCGSGLKSVALGYNEILSNPSAIVVSGGQESMSQAPHAVRLRTGVKLGEAKLVDTMLVDGLTDYFNDIHMGLTAENVAKDYGISREEQDSQAAESQRRASVAITNGRFTKEIVPVSVVNHKGITTIVDKDEFPNPKTNVTDLAKLRPSFQKQGGTVTAGNASGINDGAAAVVLMSLENAKKRGIKPLARIVGVAQGGVDPKVMGLGPIPAVKNLLQKIGWKSDDVDLYELNEAFAAISIACVRDLALDPAKVNVNGGAIALGHPIGASGTRVLVTLLHAMEDRGARRGVASLCIGGGMGIAMAVETLP